MSLQVLGNIIDCTTQGEVRSAARLASWVCGPCCALLVASLPYGEERAAMHLPFFAELLTTHNTPLLLLAGQLRRHVHALLGPVLMAS